MPARLLYHKKQEYRGGIVEMMIWQLPASDEERPHGLKYRLVYVKEGRRVSWATTTSAARGITVIFGKRNTAMCSVVSTSW